MTPSPFLRRLGKAIINQETPGTSFFPSAAPAINQPSFSRRVETLQSSDGSPHFLSPVCNVSNGGGTSTCLDRTLEDRKQYMFIHEHQTMHCGQVFKSHPLSFFHKWRHSVQCLNCINNQREAGSRCLRFSNCASLSFHKCGDPLNCQ